MDAMQPAAKLEHSCAMCNADVNHVTQLANIPVPVSLARRCRKTAHDTGLTVCSGCLQLESRLAVQLLELPTVACVDNHAAVEDRDRIAIPIMHTSDLHSTMQPFRKSPTTRMVDEGAWAMEQNIRSGDCRLFRSALAP